MLPDSQPVLMQADPTTSEDDRRRPGENAYFDFNQFRACCSAAPRKGDPPSFVPFACHIVQREVDHHGYHRSRNLLTLCSICFGRDRATVTHLG